MDDKLTGQDCERVHSPWSTGLCVALRGYSQPVGLGYVFVNENGTETFKLNHLCKSTGL